MGTSQRPLDRRLPARRAFTLVELLTVIVLAALLLAILTPALAGARRRATAAKCLANARSTSLAITCYAHDYREYVPFGGWKERTIHAPGGRDYQVGGTDGVAKGRWSLLVEDGWNGQDWSEGYRCAKQPAYNPDVTYLSSEFLTEGYLQTPMFSLSRAFWLDPRSLLAEAGRPETARVRPARIADVTFPSEKALLFEEIAFCAAGPDALWAINEWGQTPYHLSSVVTVDGAGVRMIRAEGLPAKGSWPFDATIDGVHGRDLPRSGQH